MGNKDNPRRIRNKLIAGGIGALLLVGSGWYAVNQQQTINQQDKLIHEYQQKLDEQGSLIDQQGEILSNQKQQLEDLNKRVDSLSGELSKEKEAHQKSKETFKQQKEALDAKVAKLEDELAFKKAKAKRAAVAAARTTSSNMPSRGTPSAGRMVTVEATGYIAMCSEGCTGITATGLNLKDNPHAKVIAVDPNVIPLGTKVYVPGYGYAIAADTGGGIDGWEIDIHFPTTAEAKQWGRRTVQIKILN
jgi:3D (Asp-Asp-Asp) domain-containing protein